MPLLRLCHPPNWSVEFVEVDDRLLDLHEREHISLEDQARYKLVLTRIRAGLSPDNEEAAQPSEFGGRNCRPLDAALQLSPSLKTHSV